MDSDHDLYDMEYEEEEEDEVYSDDDTVDEPIKSDNQKSYRILKDTDIRQLMKEDISKTSMVLSVPRDVSIALSRHFKWHETDANEQWFANEPQVRNAIGMLLPEKESVFRTDSNNHVTCGICFDEYSLDNIAFAACKHPFCKVCWEGYISTSINDGPNCLVLRCPEPSCNIMVGESMIVTLTSEKDRSRYHDFLFRSYVEEKKKIKWCPAPGCKCAVEFELGSENYDVTCDCSSSFCWNCLDEIHRPIDCDTIAKWRLRNSSEAENINWILAFTKKCPGCEKAIEKNRGCMHMTCKCGYQFCWLCLKKWGTCVSQCNRYQDNQRMMEAQNSIRRYTHFFERWASNEKSKQKAIKDLKEMRDEGLTELSKTHSLPEAKLEFIIQAWQQIIECRRFLKWTYAYGFYLPEDEKAKVQFFEYLQGEAEARLEGLHHCAEKEFLVHLGPDNKLDYTEEGSYKKFDSYRSKLINLTQVTGSYFDKLVTALENGLKDVNNSNESKRKREGPVSINVYEGSGLWPCDRCTYLNADAFTVCQICG